jgi:D-arabinose 5-phosphate isomerase GutQ
MRDLQDIASEVKRDLEDLLGDVIVVRGVAVDTEERLDLHTSMRRRSESIHRQVLNTVQRQVPQIDAAIDTFLRWMTEGSIVRIVGAGRARLAAAIPANRLAHGGARVYVQDDFVPMPHTIRGGGIIAASASGTTRSVLEVMESARKEGRDVLIVGIAAEGAAEFRKHCDIFIGIAEEPLDIRNPLRALADSEEYVISLVLDAIVVAAGRKGGFVDTLWRLGHENLGATGPYDRKPRRQL